MKLSMQKLNISFIHLSQSKHKILNFWGECLNGKSCCANKVSIYQGVCVPNSQVRVRYERKENLLQRMFSYWLASYRTAQWKLPLLCFLWKYLSHLCEWVINSTERLCKITFDNLLQCLVLTWMYNTKVYQYVSYFLQNARHP